MTSTCHVAVVGAGPYGLAVAAHLGDAGIEARVVGQPMAFWRSGMPRGMLVRSEWPGSHIADPHRALTLDRYEAARGTTLPRRLRLTDFVDYGLWYQRQAVPDLDPQPVTRVEARQSGFAVTLADGGVMLAERVVLATGLTGFAYRPAAFAGLPSALAPHSTEVPDPAAFAGRRVAVVGAGQSAIELAVLLGEAGAEVEVIARAPAVLWLRGLLKKRIGPLRKVVYPPGEVGPIGISWIVELPDLFRCLPQALQQHVAARAVRPAASGWLRPRLGRVGITAGRSVAAVRRDGDGLVLTLDDGSRRQVDRAVLATGFRVDLERHPLLPPELARSLRRRDGAPVLGPGLESSVPGLHFVGAAAAESFGPLMRFVAGSGYAARAVTRRILGAGGPRAGH